jgi:hypothetical protein
VSDELELRMRDSLRAYADLVDEPEPADLPRSTAPAASRGALRGWRGAAVGAAAAAAVVSWTFWVVTDDDTGVESAAGPVGSSAEITSEQPENGPLSADAAAAAPGEGQAVATLPEVGVASPLDLYTHCGVLGTDIAGVWFAADPPLVEGAGNPPAGWGNPYQPGTLTLVSAEEAVFADEVGHRVRLVADETARPGPCD